MSEKKPTLLEVVTEMERRGMDVAGYGDMLDLTRNKKGGKVTIGVGQPHFDHLINGFGLGEQTHVAVTLVIDIKQFDLILSELQNGYPKNT